MDLTKKILWIIAATVLMTQNAHAQSFTWTQSTDGNVWRQSKVKTTKDKASIVDAAVKTDEEGMAFKSWGTCFNELGWDALNTLPATEQEKVLQMLFSPQGDLKFTIGRIPMNANDYARSWYSCDTLDGDFGLRFFNVDRDMKTLIPYIHRAQKYNSNMTFWISPWSPPTWMKTNHHYAQSSTPTNGLKKELEAPTFKVDQMIMDSRYLDTYAHYFCKFIDAYKSQNIHITKVMYQNEAYSFTPYPGCTWTAKASALFNGKYLGPTLARLHPDVALYIGTFNTNHKDIVDSIIGNPEVMKYAKGVTFQWEGGQIVAAIRAKYPQYKYMQSESECGWGDFSWKAAEHTFGLICHYHAAGCDTYTFWNAIIADDGSSTWGWKQNGLIHVNSKSKTYVLTPEYYAAKHFCYYIQDGTQLIANCDIDGKEPIMVFKTNEHNILVIAGNFTNQAKPMTIKIGKRYLHVILSPHSFNTFSGNK